LIIQDEVKFSEEIAYFQSFVEQSLGQQLANTQGKIQ
jgi:hypothetical protein